MEGVTQIRPSWFGACGKKYVPRNLSLEYTGDGWYHFNGNWSLLVADGELVRYWVWTGVDPRNILQAVSALPEQTESNATDRSADKAVRKDGPVGKTPKAARS